MTAIYAAIQICSEWPTLALSAQERAEIDKSAECHGLHLVWLPGFANGRDGAGAFISADILLFLSGVAFSGLVKPLYEGAVKEAGKDIWIGIRNLIARIWKKQTDKGYTNETEVHLIFGLHEDQVFISITLPTSHKGESDSLPELEFQVETVLRLLATDWEDIQGFLKMNGVGQHVFCTPESIQVHVVNWIEKGKWRAKPIRSTEFYSNLINRAGNRSSYRW